MLHDASMAGFTGCIAANVGAARGRLWAEKTLVEQGIIDKGLCPPRGQQNS